MKTGTEWRKGAEVRKGFSRYGALDSLSKSKASHENHELLGVQGQEKRGGSAQPRHFSSRSVRVYPSSAFFFLPLWIGWCPTPVRVDPLPSPLIPWLISSRNSFNNMPRTNVFSVIWVFLNPGQLP